MSMASRISTAALLAGSALFAGAAFADEVINDDLIVIGSTCVGLDCKNGEVFNFDTLRLKENNTRIKFEDTSTSTGFPSNDWQLTANDSASGGANKFSIDDVTGSKTPFTVIAGAPTNAMFIDSIGRLGLRTSTPGLDVHIRTSDTPAHRLEQTNAGGFTAWTWDVGANEANFFVRDLTSGSRLPFRIRPGAPTSSIDIAATGLVGIGTASPTQKVDVRGGAVRLANTDFAAGSVGTFLDASLGASSGNTFAQLQGFTGGGVSPANIALNPTSGNVGIGTTGPTAKLDVNGTVRVATLGANPPANTVCFSGANVLGTCASDARLKHNVRYLQESAGLDAVMKLKPATFQWRDGDERIMAGFIAQETQAAIPEAVHKQAGSEFLSLDSAAVLSYAVRAIQELKADNDKLHSDIERLKASR
ncbi:MAG: tail fiber domain-containing protein [Alphaproteobacteria bacterium]